MAGPSPSDATPSEWIARARTLVPRLAERAPEVDRARRPDDESIAALEDAGLLSLLVPRARGGAEVGLETFCEVVATLGEGCTSTAWVGAFYMCHSWIAALLPAKAQDELFANHPWVRAPSTLAPSGRARELDAGGHVLSGRWAWGTGIAHAEEIMVAGLVEHEGQAPEPRMFVLPAGDVQVLDTWYTDGMRGTASHDIAVEDARVPSHRSISFHELVTGAGGERHPGPLYRLPLPPFLALVAALPALGTARAAVAHFRERLRERVLYLSDARQQEKPAAQMRLARADVDVRAAELLLLDLARRLESGAREGAGFSLEERAALRMNAARAVDLSRAAVRSVCEAAGARAHFEDQPLQRMLRDLETLAGHVIFDGDATAELAGRVLLGMDPDTPLV